MSTEEQPNQPTLDIEQFARFAATAWKNRDPQTRIFVGALPTKANKKIGDELKDQNKPVPPECRTHWRIFGADEAEALMRFLQHENGVRNLALKMGRYKRDASSGTPSNVQEVHFAWLDIDGGGAEGKRLAAEVLWGEGVPRPNCVVSSGGGIHAYWFYNQPLTGADLDTARTVNEHLARVFCGDESVTHVGGSLRVPGTWNANRNAPCKIVHLDDENRHDPAALLRWLDKQGPHLSRNGETLSVVPAHARDALRQHEREAENARPTKLDWDSVEAALSIEGAANPHGGRNRALTLWAGKVISMGGSVEDAVLLAVKKGCTLPEAEIRATCESVARTHERKNNVTVPRTQEDRKLRQQAVQEEDQAAQVPPPTEQVPVQPDMDTAPDTPVQEDSPAPDAAGDGGGTTSGSGHGGFRPPPHRFFGGGPAQPGDPEDTDDFDPTSAIARLQSLIRRGMDDDDFSFVVAQQLDPIVDGLREWLETCGGRVLYEVGDKAADGWWWAYTAGRGVWRLRSQLHIEKMIVDFWDTVGTGMLKNADRQEIIAALRTRTMRTLGEVPWDYANGRHLIVTADGKVLDVTSGQEVQKDPDLYLTDRRLLGATFDPKAKCPTWDAAIRMMFDDQSEKDKIALLIEEWMGSTLLNAIRPRNMYRALTVVGESLGGKSTLGHGLRSVVGNSRVVAADMETVGGSFGLSSFFENRASVWLCDDPNTETDLPDGVVKKLITNEAVNVNMKNRPMRTATLGLTVGIFCNEMPKISDASNAVYNRMLILRSGIVFEKNPDPNDHRHRKADPDLAAKFEAEKSGILNRMIDGARRLLANGGFTETTATHSAREEIHDANSPARIFARMCLVSKPDATSRIRRVHLRLAFAGYMEKENPGWYASNANRRGGEYRRLFKALKNAFPKSTGEGRDGRIKGSPTEQMYHTHMNFTPDGLTYLAEGMRLDTGRTEQNFENDIEVKKANDLAYLGFDTQGKPKLEAVSGGKAQAAEGG